MTIVDQIQLMNGRKDYYNFLAAIYKTEITVEFIDTLKKLKYESFANTSLEDGYDLINKYFKSDHIDHFTDLAADFARVFLGAGIVQKELISAPYESVYTSPERLIMQDARDKVVKIYRKNGVGKIKEFNVPEDHLAIELEFMAFLCSETVKAYENKDLEEANRLLGAQKEFIDEHLLNWCPQFCDEIKRFSRTDFYRGVALVTEEFLNADKEMLNETVSSGR